MTSPLHDITAVILAGGLGTRLRSVVTDRQKTVAEVNNRPFICYLLDRLIAAGCRQCILCTGYMSDNVKELLGDNYGALQISYSVETEPLGTGGALRLAMPLISSAYALVMNGDSFCDVDLQHFVLQHFEKNASASMVLAEVSDISRYGAVDIDCCGRVVRFEEKGERSGNGLINAGVYLLAQEIIASLPQDRACSLERELFPLLISSGLNGYPCDGRFIDIGVPEDYLAAADFFKLQQP